MTRKRWMGLILLILIGGTGWIGYRALHQAALNHDLIAVAAKGDPTRVRALLALGADPNTSEDGTAGKGLQHLLDLLMGRRQKGSSTSPLTLALTGLEHPDDNHIAVLRLLLDHGANPNVVNANGDSALNWAADQQNTKIITLLLAHGADVNHKSNHGQTALLGALPHTDPETDDPVDVLLAAGADVNTLDRQGYSPFQFALIMHSPHADAMLAHGADVRRAIPLSAKPPTMFGNMSVDGASISVSMDYAATPGTTPLMFAVRNRNAALARSILAKGVDVNARDAQGKTALAYAYDNPEIQAFLKNAGAKR